MTRRLLPFLAGACLSAAVSTASAQAPPPPWQGVYEGVIGKAAVVVALSPISARYFYVGRSNDLGLIIAEDGNLSSLQETLAPDVSADDVADNPKLISGTWSLSFARGKLTGTWKDAQGQHASAIALTRVSTADEGSDSSDATLDRPGDYASRWLHSAPALVAQGAPTTIGPLSLRMMLDPAFGGAVPRLTRAPATVALGAVNAGLERLQRYLRLQDRGCFQGQRTMTARGAGASIADIDKQNGEDDSSTTLQATYASDRLLVLEESHLAFCGGAHPSLNVTAYTFDLATGALLTGGSSEDDELDGLGPAGLGRALDLARPEQRAKFDELWRAAMRKQIAAVAASKDDDGCGKEMEALFAEPKVWINAYPTSDGLTVRLTGFPEAMRICEVDPPLNPVILPYASLKPFLKPGQKLLPTK